MFICKEKQEREEGRKGENERETEVQGWVRMKLWSLELNSRLSCGIGNSVT